MLKCDKTRKLHNSIITNLGLRKALVVAMLFTAPYLLLIVLSKLVTRRIYVQLICQKHLTRLITTAYILSWWNGMYQLRFLLFLKTGLVVVLRVLNGRTYDLLLQCELWRQTRLGAISISINCSQNQQLRTNVYNIWWN